MYFFFGQYDEASKIMEKILENIDLKKKFEEKKLEGIKEYQVSKEFNIKIGGLFFEIDKILTNINYIK